LRAVVVAEFQLVVADVIAAVAREGEVVVTESCRAGDERRRRRIGRRLSMWRSDRGKRRERGDDGDQSALHATSSPMDRALREHTFRPRPGTQPQGSDDICARDGPSRLPRRGPRPSAGSGASLRELGGAAPVGRPMNRGHRHEKLSQWPASAFPVQTADPLQRLEQRHHERTLARPGRPPGSPHLGRRRHRP
jgi:hypothetical protein